jgi:hypothetical protein
VLFVVSVVIYSVTKGREFTTESTEDTKKGGQTLRKAAEKARPGGSLAYASGFLGTLLA